MNFVKTSVITNTLSLPSLAGSNNVKSIARTSRGLVHFSHCFIHASTSLGIPGQ